MPLELQIHPQSSSSSSRSSSTSTSPNSSFGLSPATPPTDPTLINVGAYYDQLIWLSDTISTPEATRIDASLRALWRFLLDELDWGSGSNAALESFVGRHNQDVARFASTLMSQ